MSSIALNPYELATIWHVIKAHTITSKRIWANLKVLAESIKSSKIGCSMIDRLSNINQQKNISFYENELKLRRRKLNDNAGNDVFYNVEMFDIK